MKVKDLAELLSRTGAHYQDCDLVVRLTSPSIGGCAKAEIASVSFGHDWDSGNLIFNPSNDLVVKSRDESIFDAARELLMFLATKPGKRDSYEVRRAKDILKKYGYTDEDFNKYRHLYHRELKNG